MREREVGRTIGVVAGVVAMLALGAAEAAGQGLAEYDYDNLRLRGVGGEVFWVSPNNVDPTVGIGARLDLGFLGPKIRVVPRFAFWDSELRDAELDSLATRLEDLVELQNPDQPRPEIDLGTVDRDALIFGSDLHWLPLVDDPVRPYVGVGAEVYVLSGEGEAIEGTFVEDGLDLITAGVSAVGGLELQLRDALTLYTELRGSVVADASSIGLTVGIAYLRP